MYYSSVTNGAATNLGYHTYKLLLDQRYLHADAPDVYTPGMLSNNRHLTAQQKQEAQLLLGNRATRKHAKDC